MKNTIILLVAICITSSYVIASEYVSNGDIESGSLMPYSWLSNNLPTYTYSWANIGYNSSRSLMISKTKILGQETLTPFWLQIASIYLYKRYFFSGYIKTECVQGGEGACLAIIIGNDTYLSESLFGTNQWTLVSGFFDVPDPGSITTILVQARMFGSIGKAYFDNISLIGSDEIIFNKSLEEGYSDPSCWYTWHIPNHNSVFTWDNSNRYTGSKSVKIYNESELHCGVWAQYIHGWDVRKTYNFEGYLQTNNVISSTGGAYISIDCKDNNNNILGTYDSDILKGDCLTWTKVKGSMTIPEGTSVVTIGAKLYGASGTAWFDDVSIEHVSNTCVSQNKNTFNLDAFGVEWDPFLWNDSNNISQDQWDTVLDRIHGMNIKKVRMWIMPDYYEPVNDDGDPDHINLSAFLLDTTISCTPMMRSFYKHLQACQDLGINVALTWWGARNKSWLGFGLSDPYPWISYPCDFNEAAENISTLLDYLINTKHYSCIKELVILNEPADPAIIYSDPTNPHPRAFQYWYLYNAVNDRLIQNGIKNRIKLVGSEDVFNNPGAGDAWFDSTCQNMSYLLDGYDSHAYFGDVDYLGVEDSLKDHLLYRTNRSKPWYNGEFGNGNTIGFNQVSDSTSFNRALFLPMFAINNLKCGGTGCLYWCLMDQHYEAEWIMQMGLWGCCDAKPALKPRYIYHSWALINKYSIPGSEIYDIQNCPYKIDAVALKSPEGYWTYHLVNRNWNPIELSIHNSYLNAPYLNTYIFSRDLLPDSNNLSAEVITSSGTVTPYYGDVQYTIPARSYVVLSNVVYGKNSDRASNADIDTKISTTNIIKQIAPNPFSNQTIVYYHLREPGVVKIHIYNAIGQLVRILSSERQPPGAHSVVWNGKSDEGRTLPDGIYICKMQCNEYSGIKKIILVK